MQKAHLKSTPPVAQSVVGLLLAGAVTMLHILTANSLIRFDNAVENGCLWTLEYPPKYTLNDLLFKALCKASKKSVRIDSKVLKGDQYIISFL